MASCEQQARDILERMEIKGAQNFRPSEVVEIANLISDLASARVEIEHKTNALRRIVDALTFKTAVGPDGALRIAQDALSTGDK